MLYLVRMFPRCINCVVKEKPIKQRIDRIVIKTIVGVEIILKSLQVIPDVQAAVELHAGGEVLTGRGSVQILEIWTGASGSRVMGLIGDSTSILTRQSDL